MLLLYLSKIRLKMFATKNVKEIFLYNIIIIGVITICTDKLVAITPFIYWITFPFLFIILLRVFFIGSKKNIIPYYSSI